MAIRPNSTVQRKGFCPNCQQNVQHSADFKSWWLRWVLYLTGQRMPLGDWNCDCCGHGTWILAKPRVGVATLVSDDKPCLNAAVPVDNYLQRRSIAERQQRTYPYSEKYRESIVQKLLSGQSSLLELREELGLSESDFLNWIHESMQRKEKQIQELTTTVAMLRQMSLQKIADINHNQRDGNGSSETVQATQTEAADEVSRKTNSYEKLQFRKAPK